MLFPMEKLVRGVQNVNRKRWPLVVHLLLFITILETVVAQLSNTSSAGTDFEALVNIRNSFASTSLSTNWTGSNFCSNWIGVTCNNESRVVNLTLSSKSLAEYAWASLASTKGDVFSFGIVLLETLTARKPYENWDVEEGQPGSLVEVVRSAYPDKIMSILDANMVALELVGGLYRQEVTLVMKIGLLCTQDDPRNRPDMIDVLNMLTEIKVQRYTEAKSEKLPDVLELANSPTIWDFEENQTSPILRMTEETRLEDWIARRQRWRS